MAAQNRTGAGNVERSLSSNLTRPLAFAKRQPAGRNVERNSEAPDHIDFGDSGAALGVADHLVADAGSSSEIAKGEAQPVSLAPQAPAGGGKARFKGGCAYGRLGRHRHRQVTGALLPEDVRPLMPESEPARGDSECRREPLDAVNAAYSLALLNEPDRRGIPTHEKRQLALA